MTFLLRLLPLKVIIKKKFGQLGYVEQTGHGIPLIIGKYGIQAFGLMDNYLNVIIPFRRELVVNNEITSRDTSKLLPKQLAIYKNI